MNVEQPQGAPAGTSGIAGARKDAKSTGSLDRASEWHAKGRFDDAAREYEAVLAGQPGHAGALHGYGVLQYQRGRTAEAETVLRRSVSLKPEVMSLSDLGGILVAAGRREEALVQFDAALRIDSRHVVTLVRLGDTLLEMRRYAEALAAYDRALAVSPLVLDALSNRGGALRALARYQEALDTYDRALTVAPRSFESYYNRGLVLRDLQRYTEALQSYDQALAIMPRHPAILLTRGRTLIDLGRPSEALVSLNDAIASQPDFVEALYNSAIALERLGRANEAMQRCERVLALEPRHAGALISRGNALLRMAQCEAALSDYTLALEIESGSREALCNAGTALRYLGRYDEALRSYDGALALDEKFAEAWSNRGGTLYQMCRAQEALESYDRATAIDPNYAEAHVGRAMLFLSEGDFTRGWPDYEWRLSDPKAAHRARILPQPMWRGETPLAGKTILVHAEQGFGDTLQFCRYATLLAERGAHVVLEVHPPLKSLLMTLHESVQVVPAGELLPTFDCHCPLLSLPFAFATDQQSVPNRTPYLHPDRARVQRWENLLGSKQRLRIGLAWSGNREHVNDRSRSIGLATLMPLLEADAQWISLQKDVRDEDARVLGDSGIVCVEDEMRDFADTAALVQSLDLVISVDTAIAHLAGALNRPVWILLPDPAEWRWLRDREDSPWYPGARLFRQQTAGRWQDVIHAVRDAITELKAL
ncbi:tetratricopeptide repeat protein [Paraburkholderia sp. BCC1885]|uniref:tetratricopeptide repeat protein n=1 Tax=Paraburkholderia sp. BCC1885 TaxID=2562669 RepID=UPI00118469F5|nr:tetratricopeptide repeat protein [Paraburkholderia sp. BCC1885]